MSQINVCILLILGILGQCQLLWADGKTDPPLSFAEAKEHVIMRQIGHKILQYTKDSTSRVLPVEEVEEREYHISFESNFSFHPDSLVEVIDQVIAGSELPQDYIVRVVECGTNRIIYAYAILPEYQQYIVPCGGRPQPKKCYTIQLSFPPEEQAAANMPWLGVLILIPILVLGGLGWKKRQTDPILEETDTTPTPAPTEASPAPPLGISLGQFQFLPEEQLLILNQEQVKLTSKEAQLLHFLYQHHHRVVDRTIIQQEVWGTKEIVSRSLDMYISKLRKKLEADADLQLVNIHGKGYKLVWKD